ncbi:Two-component response regulator ARR16 [Zea mays]|uniref:Two-component response regulator ARR16 n=1 Tax=Zea mays TaxID=4577 RepID=A0A1D6Q396_MAIZE|nr:Two-component response regulator ARR16 [Zea mays]
MGQGGEVKAAPAVRVLVVDDSPVDRKVVELLLRNHNHQGGAAPFHVTAVDSGKKAMEHLRLMEQGGQLDSCAADANALSSPNPIPVVVMSSENEPQRISRCLTAGAEDFILKPLKTKDVQRLRNCSSAARPRDDAAHQCESLRRSSRKLRSDQVAAPGHRSQPTTGLTMVLHASSIELSHYFQFLLKFVLLAYAVLCLTELLHRWSNGSVLSLWSA